MRSEQMEGFNDNSARSSVIDCECASFSAFTQRDAIFFDSEKNFDAKYYTVNGISSTRERNEFYLANSNRILKCNSSRDYNLGNQSKDINGPNMFYILSVADDVTNNASFRWFSSKSSSYIDFLKRSLNSHFEKMLNISPCFDSNH
jgi:hypothetical protein